MTPLQGRPCVLIVDGDADIRDLLSQLVRDEGHEPIEAGDGEQALAAVGRHAAEVVFLDIPMPGESGLDVLRQMRRRDPTLAVVIMTRHGNMDNAVAAMRSGAQDFIVKPFTREQLTGALRRAGVQRRLRLTIDRVSQRPPEDILLHELMGPSRSVQRICTEVATVARSNFTVLILGETGSGKELVARGIHRASLRADGPFVPVDCGAIPDTLVESELFGYEKGAFTGAQHSKPGRFETAAGGTLFLDEISNMRLDSQTKLLRALQEHIITRVGGNQPLPLDTRIIVATNEDLEAAVRRGAFRQDIFFRLNEFPIRIPPLRERKEDIIFLATRILKATNAELGKSISGLSERARVRLLEFSWPGNVRQLQGAIRRAVLLADTLIDVDHLRLPAGPQVSGALPPLPGAHTTFGDRPLREVIREATQIVERAAVLRALEQASWNKAKAARLLSIDYKTMHAKLREHGLNRPREGKNEKTEA